MSSMSKTSACLWPSSLAMSITHVLFFVGVLSHVPYLTGKIYLVTNLIFAFIMGYKWMQEVYNNR